MLVVIVKMLEIVIFTLLLVVIINFLVVFITAIFHVMQRLVSVVLWCFFHHSPGVQNLVRCLYYIFEWVIFEADFEGSNKFVGRYNSIITNFNFCPLRVITFWVWNFERGYLSVVFRSRVLTNGNSRTLPLSHIVFNIAWFLVPFRVCCLDQQL